MINRYFRLLREQVWRHWGKTTVLYLTAVAICLAVVAANYFFGIPVATLVRDPTSLGNLPPWAGAFSNIGILFWCAAMTLAFAGAMLAARQPANARLYTFLIASGLVTGFLMLDDLFVMHESFRDYLGFPEKASFAIILAVLGVYLLGYGRVILTTDAYFLAAAFLFLGASLGLDNIQYTILNYLPNNAYYLLEDGLKLIGIVNWFGYFLVIFSHLVNNQAGMTGQTLETERH